MLYWNYIVIVLCLLLLAFLCAKEWQRPKRSRRYLRLAASFIAVACFACFALPLTRKIPAAAGQGTQAVLLTEGFNKDSVNRFLNETNHLAPVYAMDNQVMAGAKNFKATFVSTADWPLLKQQLSAIHVFGNGLQKDEMQALPATAVVFHPAALPDGVTAVNWPRKLKAGNRLTVQGNFLNTASTSVTLILNGYGLNLDTAIIPAHKNGYFELTASPKQLGKATYSLAALSGKDTLENEPVPFEVEQPDDVKILILSASPDFENKFLKSWLSQHGYALISRTTISKSRYEKTFLNTPPVSFSSINTAFLQNFNVLIADVSELAAISKAELGAIESLVALKGLGLIVKGDSASTKNAFYARPFPAIQSTGNTLKALDLLLPAGNDVISLPVEHPVYIRPQAGTQSLIQDKQLNILVNSSLYGSGKIIYTTINNTYTWMLSGSNDEYQAYWSYLLEKATAKTDAGNSWSISPAVPYVNCAADIRYVSNDAHVPQAQVGQDFIHLVQDAELPFRWQGTYWPTHAGWQPVMQQGKKTFWWYAYQLNDWKTLSASRKIAATWQSIGAGNTNLQDDDRRDTEQTIPINKIYFFIMFIISAGFLWIEKKLL